MNTAPAPANTMDLHLGATGVADNKVASPCPTSLDIDEQPRLAPCDAGADER
jgi:hypothetical protein